MFRLCAYAFAVIAAGLAFAIQAAAAGPIPAAGPGLADSRLLHLVHGRHGACIRGHRHRWDGLPLRCNLEDDDDGGDGDDGGNGDDGDDGDDDGTCVQIGPLQYCQQ